MRKKQSPKARMLDFPDTTPENIRAKLPYNNYRIAPAVLTDKSVYVIK